MIHMRVSVLTIGVCAFLAANAYGQLQKPTRSRSIDATTTVSKPVEPDSPGTSSIVAAGPQAVIPRLMKFSGALHDASGKPLSGTVDVTFALYNTEAGGTPLWFETQSVQADELGRYTALLGAMHTDGLPIDLFTSGEVRWLGIQVGLELEQPRVLLVSVPYALKAGDAETLGGKPASAYMLSEAQSGEASGATTTSTTGSAQTGTSGTTKKSRTANTSPLTPVCASVTSNTGGTANSVVMFDAACDVVNSSIFQSGANVGIGTATPGSTLHLVGNNSTLTISGTGTHQVNIVGATGGRLGQDATGFFFSSDTNGAPIRFATNNGSAHEWMRLTSAGNLGIGTSTPAKPLDIASLGGILMDRTEDQSTNNEIFFADNGQIRSKDDFHRLIFDRTSNIMELRDYGSIVFSPGATASTRTQKMTFTSGGRVGIGTASPVVTLHAVSSGSGLARFQNDGTGSDHSSLVDVENGEGNLWRVGVGGTGNGLGFTGGQFYIEESGSGEAFRIDTSHNIYFDGANGIVDNGGQWGLGCTFRQAGYTVSLCAGSLNGKGISYGWDTYSSQRFKTNIQTLHGGLSKVEKLRGVTYNDKSDGKPEVGVIAEEAARVLPEIVGHDKDGEVVGLDYSRLTAVLIEAVKEQQHQIKAQRELIRKQNAKLAFQQTSLKTQQEQIAQLASQVSIIQASLNLNGKSATAVPVAKAVEPTRHAWQNSIISHAAGGGR